MAAERMARGRWRAEVAEAKKKTCRRCGGGTGTAVARRSGYENREQR